MANPNNPFGFRAVSRGSGAPIFAREYAKAAAVGTAIFQNDLVLKAATSVVSPTGNLIPAPGITTVGITPGTSLFMGASLNYGAASVATYHYVVDQVDALFMAQGDDTTAITVADSVGKTANMLATAGNTTTKQSKHSVDASTITTNAATQDLHIVSMSRIVPNAEGAYGIVEVTILKHALIPGVAGT